MRQTEPEDKRLVSPRDEYTANSYAKPKKYYFSIFHLTELFLITQILFAFLYQQVFKYTPWS